VVLCLQAVRDCLIRGGGVLQAVCYRLPSVAYWNFWCFLTYVPISSVQWI